MYPLHDMDHNYIIQSIESSMFITEVFKRSLLSSLKHEEKLAVYEKDYIILTLKHDYSLSPSYKEMLILKIKEG